MPFPHNHAFKLGKARWYCATTGNILLRASLFSCLSDAFLSLNFTPARRFGLANNGQTGYINSTSKIYSYCYQNSHWQLTRFQVESKPQSCSELTFKSWQKSSLLGNALLSDEKIVTRKQSKANSVTRKSNVNSDENVNQPADVLKNQDTRGRQIACKTRKLSSLRPKFQKKTLHSWTLKCTKVQDSTKNLSIKCKYTTNLLRIFNTQISVGSKHLPGKKRHNTIHKRAAGVA